MKNQRLLRPGPVCQLCQLRQHLPKIPKHERFIRSTSTLTARRIVQPPPLLPRFFVQPKRTLTTSSAINDLPQNASTEQNGKLAKAQELGDAILATEGIPSEETIVAALQACETAAKTLSYKPSMNATNKDTKTSDTTASALFNINSTSPSSRIERADAISSLAYNIVTHPTVFISPQVLKTYITTQCLLKRPESFPEVFDLYATKPVPQPGSTPIRYKTPNPNKVSAAVDKAVADTALNSAIRVKDLYLALSIIEMTYRTEAFRNNKILKEAGVPIAGAVAAPFAVYALASQISNFQHSMDPGTATKMTFAAITTYILATSTIGIVAITTRNDQMERVTWATGLALRERWIREPERAAVDKVATAWGFKDVGRRGEEEGEEWELLKEWAGNRGMMIDRADLMEGME